MPLSNLSRQKLLFINYKVVLDKLFNRWLLPKVQKKPQT